MADAVRGLRRAIGLMSGTSADGVDAALVETDGERVLSCGAALTQPYPAGLRDAVLGAMARAAGGAEETLGELEAAVTEANAAAARALVAVVGAVDVVGLHGQTIVHRPGRGFTRQLGDGATLAGMLGVDVVNRFRDADVAAGGEGAPLAPLFHQALLAGVKGPVAVLNLGGVGNVTYVDGGELLAFDTGPANALIDDWVRRHTGAGFDADGALAASGRVDAAALAALLAHPYFARRPPKSLDRNAFSMAPVEGLGVADGAATLAAFTVAAVAQSVRWMRAPPLRWVVGGGGRHNAGLMRGLAAALAAPVEKVEALGWDGDALEAQAFGFLAVRALRGLPLSLPGTTGVGRPMRGGVVHRVHRAGVV